ncbi:hypothetical protein [Micromonospora chersina]|uniref:hypothetical protein n=1 Tax=Micromonospora chersina TaxID=47854 RepID=UPI003D8D08A7
MSSSARVVAARLDRRDVVDLVAVEKASGTDVAALRREAGDLRARLDVPADALADGEMTRDQFARANRRAQDRLAEVEGRLTEVATHDVLAGLHGPGAGRLWLTSDDIQWRRAVLAALVEVALHPVKTGRPKEGEQIDPTSIEFRWRGDELTWRQRGFV